MRCLPAVPCWYEDGASIPCAPDRAVHLCIVVVLLVALLFVCRPRRSRARESDPDVSCEDPFSVMLPRLSCDDRDDVSQRVGVEKIYSEPLSNNGVCFRTIALEHQLTRC